MAANFPIFQVPTIAEPCQQSWERMPGSARVRHCASCDQDVVNLAAMSSAEIAALLQGPIPCLRIARHDDGTLVTTEPPATHSLPRIAAGLLTAALSVTAAAAQQTSPQTPPAPPQPSQQTRQQPLQGVTLGAPLPARQAPTKLAPAKTPVPRQPQSVTTGRVARPTPPPPPVKSTPQTPQPAKPSSVLMGSVAVTSVSGTIPLDPAPLPLDKKSLPQK